MIADVCLCEYTSHGHCGVVARDGDHYEIENDSSVALIAKTAASLAKAGADIVAPSDMMDGRVTAIRDALDAGGHEQIPVMSYASKFASAFYGPFREAADSAPQFGDRDSYQMDGANLREAMREIDQDIAEGADMLLMKPAMPYLDVIRAARERYDLPMGAYQVSGEYSMLHAAFQRGWLEPERAMMESLLVDTEGGGGFYRDVLREGRGQGAGLDSIEDRLPMARIAIVGVGAIGGVTAALLQQAGGHQLLLVHATPDVWDFQSTTPDGLVDVHATFVTDPSEAFEVDWVIVATKAYDVAGAAKWLEPLCSNGAPVAVLQNGVEHQERFAPYVPMEKILPVMVDCPAERQAPDRVRQRGVMHLKVPDSALGRSFVNLFAGTSTDATMVPDFQERRVAKTLLQLGGCPVSVAAATRRQSCAERL